MAQGTWDDFTDKYGFGDGCQLEDRDFAAREVLVRLLNEQPEMMAAKMRAIKYDRPGVHNSCLVLISPVVEGKSDEELLKALDWANVPELPEMEAGLNELIAQAYEEAEGAEKD